MIFNFKKNLKNPMRLSGESGAGFSILELLVVVAIISVLAAIVLTNVTEYINRGKNAAVKANLSTILTNSAVYFDENGNFTDFCTSSGYANSENEANTASGSTTTKVCEETSFCSCSPLRITNDEPVGSTFCVDSTGYKNITLTDCSARCSGVGTCFD